MFSGQDCVDLNNCPFITLYYELQITVQINKSELETHYRHIQ